MLVRLLTDDPSKLLAGFVSRFAFNPFYKRCLCTVSTARAHFRNQSWYDHLPQMHVASDEGGHSGMMTESPSQARLC